MIGNLPRRPLRLKAKIAGLEAAAKAGQSAGDNAWMLTSAALVLMMTGPGLPLLWRIGQEEECAGHDAKFRPDGHDYHHLGSGGL